jgi:hypothetical protein
MTPAKMKAAYSSDLEYRLENEASPEQVLRALALVLPEGSMLLVEGTRLATDLVSMYSRLGSYPDARVPRDNTTPSSVAFSIPANFDRLIALAGMLETRPTSEIADHIKIYDSAGLLVVWHDLGLGCCPPLFASRLVKGNIRFLQTDHDLDIRRCPGA